WRVVPMPDDHRRARRMPLPTRLRHECTGRRSLALLEHTLLCSLDLTWIYQMGGPATGPTSCLAELGAYPQLALQYANAPDRSLSKEQTSFGQSNRSDTRY